MNPYKPHLCHGCKASLIGRKYYTVVKTGHDLCSFCYSTSRSAPGREIAIGNKNMKP